MRKITGKIAILLLLACVALSLAGGPVQAGIFDFWSKKDKAAQSDESPTVYTPQNQGDGFGSWFGWGGSQPAANQPAPAAPVTNDSTITPPPMTTKEYIAKALKDQEPLLAWSAERGKMLEKKQAEFKKTLEQQERKRLKEEAAWNTAYAEAQKSGAQLVQQSANQPSEDSAKIADDSTPVRAAPASSAPAKNPKIFIDRTSDDTNESPASVYKGYR